MIKKVEGDRAEQFGFVVGNKSDRYGIAVEVLGELRGNEFDGASVKDVPLIIKPIGERSDCLREIGKRTDHGCGELVSGRSSLEEKPVKFESASHDVIVEAGIGLNAMEQGVFGK